MSTVTVAVLSKKSARKAPRAGVAKGKAVKASAKTPNYRSSTTTPTPRVDVPGGHPVRVRHGSAWGVRNAFSPALFVGTVIQVLLAIATASANSADWRHYGFLADLANFLGPAGAIAGNMVQGTLRVLIASERTTPTGLAAIVLWYPVLRALLRNNFVLLGLGEYVVITGTAAISGMDMWKLAILALLYCYINRIQYRPIRCVLGVLVTSCEVPTSMTIEMPRLNNLNGLIILFAHMALDVIATINDQAFRVASARYLKTKFRRFGNPKGVRISLNDVKKFLRIVFIASLGFSVILNYCLLTRLVSQQTVNISLKEEMDTLRPALARAEAVVQQQNSTIQSFRSREYSGMLKYSFTGLPECKCLVPERVVYINSTKEDCNVGTLAVHTPSPISVPVASSSGTSPLIVSACITHVLLIIFLVRRRLCAHYVLGRLLMRAFGSSTSGTTKLVRNVQHIKTNRLSPRKGVAAFEPKSHDMAQVERLESMYSPVSSRRQTLLAQVSNVEKHLGVNRVHARR